MTTNPTAPQDGGEKLAPCPLCGSSAELWKAHPDRPARKAWIACVGRCCIMTREYMTDAEAIAAWNTRAAPDLAAARNAALEEAAKVADIAMISREGLSETHHDRVARYHNESRGMEARSIASAIRALQQKGPPNG